MAVEQYANNAETTLNGAITNVATSLVVQSAVLFPTSGPFKIIVEAEIMKVTAVAGTTFTVVRGQEGTTAAAHGNGAGVVQVVTKDSLIAVGTNIIREGTFASRPAAGVEGRIYIPTDGYTFARDDGTKWVPYGPISPALTPPVNGDFAWINQGGATVTADKDAVVFFEAGQGNTTSVRIRKKAAPATPYTITAMFTTDAGLTMKNNLMAGLVFRESGTGQFVFWGLQTSQMRVFKYTSPTALNVQYQAQVLEEMPRWWRIEDNGTDRKSYFSHDGLAWVLFHTVGRLDFLTTGADEVGFAISAQNSATPNLDVTMNLLHWKQT